LRFKAYLAGINFLFEVISIESSIPGKLVLRIIGVLLDTKFDVAFELSRRVFL